MSFGSISSKLLSLISASLRMELGGETVVSIHSSVCTTCILCTCAQLYYTCTYMCTCICYTVFVLCCY